ncbi:metallophosphoesterase [Chelativorans sp. M5D2P16]|uniref:metallophosphoesterase n=1 Tax=Chelativorans sp. M5D2P16 TaxID=3095678 RepID=UPI002ACA139F|nr:metallophosphoesterase [Chelativorans sp. M5D2P16]MDZ5696679.1 metallophosphoesterase [Chelativorans sp. M5D2P16]
MLKFVVLADLHLVPEGELCHGLDTADRLRRVIDHVNEHHGDADFCVIAGDIADRGEQAAYERFKKIVAKLRLPLYATLGNHDRGPAYLELFGAECADETGCLDHIVDVKGHRVIVLDSSQPGVGAGVLQPEQHDWLRARLAEAHDMAVIVVLHHNVTQFHVQTDFIILEDSDTFLDILKTHPDVRQVVSGHVHMNTSGTVRGIPFCTFAGNHYTIAPTLASRSGPFPGGVPRYEGPGQYAVVLADSRSTVVHFENFIDRHIVMAPELFWKKPLSKIP